MEKNKIVGYEPLVNDLKQLIQKKQYRALQMINSETINLYWEIGEEIYRQQKEKGWGKSIVGVLSRELQKEFPGSKGYSASNLWRMRNFYLTYRDSEKLAPLVREISWSNNIIIVEKCKDDLQREFYIQMVKRYGWTKRVLINFIEAQTYEKYLLNQTNFDLMIPEERRAQAKLAVKDEYTFDFAELSPEYSEHELEMKLVNNIRAFLVEMGGDFTFVGNQYHLVVGTRDLYIDLLLFHRRLRSLVAIELKIGEFEAEYAGKMQLYLSVLDEQIKLPEENPSIGIIICKSKDKTYVEYGEYGTIKLFHVSELEDTEGQISFFETLGIKEQEEAADVRLPTLKKTAISEETIALPRVAVLNAKQQQAVESIEPVVAVVAGPGTGKTKTLVSRILHLLNYRKVKPSEITAVTFTKKAAREMQERLQQELGKKQSVRQIQIGTFHSICLELLKSQGMEFTIADAMLTREIAEETVKEFQLGLSISQFLKEISLWKTKKDADVSKTGIPEEALQYYQQQLIAKNALDFDDLLIETIGLLHEKEELELPQFHYLLVDEFQDISPVQYELIRLWNNKGRELFVIGDPDQSIYGFRGSDSACFATLQKEYTRAQVIRLTENYRSTGKIVESAMAVISHNSGEERTLHAALGNGKPVRVIEASSEMAEAVFVAKEINRQIGGIDMLDTEKSFERESERRQRSFGDIGVLYRTHRQAKLLENSLRKEGIPYVITGREDFLLEPEVRGTVCFFRSIAKPEDSLARILALRLLWKLPENVLTSEIYETMKAKYQPLLKRSKPGKLLQKWQEDMNLKGNKAMDNLEHMAMCYQNTEEFLSSLSLGEEGDLMRCGGKTYRADVVTLMTLHASKGLEFPVVLLAGAEEDKLPLENGKEPADIEEERRLFYVGMTRAKEELMIIHGGQPSMFLEELPLSCIEKEKTGKKVSGEEAEQMNLFEFL